MVHLSRRLRTFTAGCFRQTLLLVAMAALAGCEAPPNGGGGGSSQVDALPRLDQICHYIVMTCNGTGGQDDVTLLARRQSAGIENTSVLLDADSIAAGWVKAVAQVERSASDLPFPQARPYDWSALSRAIARLQREHWFVKMEKNGNWTLTVKRRAEDELFGHTELLEAADPDDLTGRINQYLKTLAKR